MNCAISGYVPAEDIIGEESKLLMEKFIGVPVSQITSENRYAEVSLGAEIEREIVE